MSTIKRKVKKKRVASKVSKKMSVGKKSTAEASGTVTVQRRERPYFPRIKEAIGRLVFWETHGFGPKVYLHFRIEEPGAIKGQDIYFPCTAAKLSKPHGRDGSFEVKETSKFYTAFERLGYPPDQFGRRGLHRMKDGFFRFSIRTVTKTSSGKKKDSGKYYSVVDELLDFTSDDTSEEEDVEWD